MKSPPVLFAKPLTNGCYLKNMRETTDRDISPWKPNSGDGKRGLWLCWNMQSGNSQS